MTTVPISLQKLISGQMQFMRAHGFETIMVSSDFGDKRKLEEREESLFIPVNMTRVISPLADVKSLWELIQIFREHKPNIVHTHTPKAGLLGMIAARLVGVPIRLHTVAGLPLMKATGLKRSILNFVERVTYACATKVYPNSSNLKEFIIREQFCPASKLKVIGNGSSNGINTTEFIRNEATNLLAQEIRDQHGLNEKDFIFVFVGRLVKDKGIEELVSAFSSLKLRYSNLKLILVGPEEGSLDPLSPDCRHEIKINPAIIAVGYQVDVKPYLSLSNALVFPSYREGFPNVPMQAGCFDLPSIVTNINGCNEIIIEGENGLIIPVKNKVALSEAMERLYLDNEMYNEMRAKARRMIVDRYEQEKVWSLILKEYDEHLKSKNIV